MVTQAAQPPRVGARAVVERNCSGSRAIDVIGDGWSSMILRECFFGTRRFEGFQRVLGIPRYSLTVRLRRLVDEGILRPVPYSERPLRHEYRLTAAGLALCPVMLVLVSFGDRWLLPDGKMPLRIVHARCGQACHAQVNCSQCGGELLAHRTAYRDGPGSGMRAVVPQRPGRPIVEPTTREALCPSIGARTLGLIGDRWRFMIIREAFFRARQVAAFQTRLGIPPKILGERLAGLVADGIFRIHHLPNRPETSIYGLTDLGRDLFGTMLALMRWGDDWRAGSEPPLLLTHLDCGCDCVPVICCHRCGEPLVAREVRSRIERDAAAESHPRHAGGADGVDEATGNRAG